MVGTQNSYEVVLTEDTEALDEVVVTVYGGSQQRAALTTPISQVQQLSLELRKGMNLCGFNTISKINPGQSNYSGLYSLINQVNLMITKGEANTTLTVNTRKCVHFCFFSYCVLREM